MGISTSHHMHASPSSPLPETRDGARMDRPRLIARTASARPHLAPTLSAPRGGEGGGILRRFLKNDDGASAVEFAIVVVVFLTVVFGIIVYGSYFSSRAIIAHVAQEAARASIPGLTDSERTSLATARASAVVADFTALLNESSIVVQATAPSAGLFRVSVTHQADLLGLGGLTAFLPMPPTTQTATFTVSNGGY